MKKSLLVILIISLAIFTTACSEKENTKNNTNGDTDISQENIENNNQNKEDNNGYANTSKNEGKATEWTTIPEGGHVESKTTDSNVWGEYAKLAEEKEEVTTQKKAPTVKEVEETTTQTKTEKKRKILSFEGSIKDLMTQSKSIVCTFGDKEGMISYTMYLADGKVRIDSIIKNDLVGTIEGTAIIKDMIMYNSANGMGFKIDLSAFENLADTASEIENPADLYKENFNFKCKFWRADDSKFDLPSNIKYQDMSEMMGQMMKQIGQ